jgi:hypothetical protein
VVTVNAPGLMNLIHLVPSFFGLLFTHALFCLLKP